MAGSQMMYDREDTQAGFSAGAQEVREFNMEPRFTGILQRVQAQTSEEPPNSISLTNANAQLKKT